MKILSIQNYNYKNTQNPDTAKIHKQHNFGTLHFSNEMIDVFKRKEVSMKTLLKIKNNTKDLSKYIFDNWLNNLTQKTYNTNFSSRSDKYPENVINSAYYSIADKLNIDSLRSTIKKYVETKQIKGICKEYAERMNNSLKEVFQKNGEDFDIDVFTYTQAHSYTPGDGASSWTDFVIFDVPGLGYISKYYADHRTHWESKNKLVNAIVKDFPAGKFGSFTDFSEKEPNSQLAIELKNTLEQVNNEARAKFENIFEKKMAGEVKRNNKYNLLK